MGILADMVSLELCCASAARNEFRVDVDSSPRSFPQWLASHAGEQSKEEYEK